MPIAPVDSLFPGPVPAPFWHRFSCLIVGTRIYGFSDSVVQSNRPVSLNIWVFRPRHVHAVPASSHSRFPLLAHVIPLSEYGPHVQFSGCSAACPHSRTAACIKRISRTAFVVKNMLFQLQSTCRLSTVLDLDLPRITVSSPMTVNGSQVVRSA